MSKQTFQELIWVDLADGTQIVNSTTETIVCPDFTFAAYDPRIYPGATLKQTVYFDVSNIVTTPGTLTFRQRWGGAAGTSMAASAAISLDTTARSNFSGRLEFVTVWRTIGPTGSAYTMGLIHLTDIGAGAAGAPPYNLAPASSPAVTSSLDTTTSKALSVTAQFSVANAGNQLTAHIRLLELKN